MTVDVNMYLYGWVSLLAPECAVFLSLSLSLSLSLCVCMCVCVCVRAHVCACVCDIKSEYLQKTTCV